MAQLHIEIGGQAHLIGCEDGQESRVRELASSLDGRIRQIQGSVGDVDHVRLLVMAALLAEDTARTALEKVTETEARAARLLEEAADKIDAAARDLSGENA